MEQQPVFTPRWIRDTIVKQAQVSYVRQNLQVMVHEYLLSTVFVMLADRRHSQDAQFKSGWNWGLREALKISGLGDSLIDTFSSTAIQWAEANCPGSLDGTNCCKAGCYKCSYMQLPCTCGATELNPSHDATCPAAYNLCLCSEAGSQKGKHRWDHARWCPRYEQR